MGGVATDEVVDVHDFLKGFDGGLFSAF